jgi:DNA-binding NtrC family response regulator
MCIDDEPNLLKLYERTFAGDGYKVVSAQTKLEAIEQLNRSTVDLVVLDIKLGEEDGLELLREFRLKDPNMPVILNSAYSNYKSDFQSWLASEYLVKSADLTELKSAVKRLLEGDATAY